MRRPPENLTLFSGISDLSPENPIYFESLAHHNGFGLVAGVDEAGRGPLAGPVVAAAVILFQPFECSWDDSQQPKLKDSKEMSASAREEASRWIIDRAVAYSTAVVSGQEIDQGNILKASLKAMRLAVEALRPRPDILLVDGIHAVPTRVAQWCIKKGDQRSISISAASILAKVYRDRIMEAFHSMYPQYGFHKNKGYGTRQHLDALRQWGPCPIHRLSFKGVARI